MVHGYAASLPGLAAPWVTEGLDRNMPGTEIEGILTRLCIVGRVLILASCMIFAGCAVNPVTGENELSLVSTAQEIAIGEQQYRPSQQSQGGLYYLDPTLQTYVSELGQRLASMSHVPDMPYEFVVLNNDTPNAWALPGGKIAINRGLLTELEDEAQLAAVLGHEIVHAAARHSASQMSRGTLVGLTAQLASIAAATYGYGDLGNLASQVGGAAVMAKYGRDDELEADEYGMGYMHEAGYDPAAAVELQETFVRLSEGRQQDFISGLFASHPPSQARVQANREHARNLTGGQRYRDRYQRHISQLKKDAKAYEAQSKAMTALKAKKAEVALKHLDTAVGLQPDEAQFWEMRGHAWAMMENSENAQAAYTTAIRKNPDVFSPHLYRGITRYRDNDLAGARGDLAISYGLLPTALSAYYLGDIFLQSGGEEQAADYLRQALRSQDQELALAAYNKLAQIEMGRTPYKYIVSRVVIGNDGYLYIALKNTTNFPVTSIKVELAELSGPSTVARRTVLRGSYSLPAQQQTTVRTGIGPLQDPRMAQRFRSAVIAAEQAGQLGR